MELPPMNFQKMLFKSNITSILSFYLITIILSLISNLSAQPETSAWGNINGIRVDGELLKF